MDAEKTNKTLKERMTEIRSTTDYRLDSKKDVLIMVDGHNFSKMIKNKFALPFDEQFVSIMDETARLVAKELQVCKFAYVQSDEITFYLSPNKDTDNSLPFGGRLCKLQSIVSGMATKYFNYLMFTKTALDGLDSKDLVEFDCKAWNVDSINDAFAYFIWRQNDCVRNSKNQVAQAFFSHKELQNKSADEQVEMLLKEKWIDWNAFSAGLKYGRFIYADKIEKIGMDGKPCIRTVWTTHDGFVLNAKTMQENYAKNDGRFWEEPKENKECKKAYILTTSLMNGSVTMVNFSSCYTSRELAEKASEAVYAKNKDSEYEIYNTIQETDIYESEKEVPILNC